MTDGYPVVLHVRGRRCVVIGGGAVGARKVAALVAASADVLVVAPTVNPELDAWDVAGVVNVLHRPFEPSDLDGAFLVIAATDHPDVNRAVVDAAQARGVLVNIADNPHACDFTVPATIRRGDVTVAISTGGRSPAFARYLRQDLEHWLTPERCEVLELVADVRRELRGAGQPVNSEKWQLAIDDPAVASGLAAGDREDARRRILAWLTADS